MFYIDNLITLPKGGRIWLSLYLIEKQNLTQEQVDIIKNLHIKKYKLYKQCEDIEYAKKNSLKLDKKITKVEFDLQKAWSFPQDINYHKFWNIPNCKCPKIDNEDVYPSGYYARSGNCVLHGLREYTPQLPKN